MDKLLYFQVNNEIFFKNCALYSKAFPDFVAVKHLYRFCSNIFLTRKIHHKKDKIKRVM